ncbi:MAG: Protein N-acetyltransferase, RimJ/RimL family [Acidobacteriales bacterium]|nr:Protein N-acetyltransferase, RimJ/RimL family [Terriglobales bacterium]
MIVVETERLVLRRMVTDDAEFILGLLNEPSFLKYIGDKGVRTLADAREYISSGPIASYLRFGHGLYLVLLKATGVPIGICGLLKRETLKDPDIGFAFLPQYCGQGYAMESAAAVMRYGQSALRMTRIVAITSPGNEASIKLLEKLGMKYEETVRMGKDADEVKLFGTPPA